MRLLVYFAVGRQVDCFFFQAEDGIRDKLVTGVQTCALPILDRGDDDVARLLVGLLARAPLDRSGELDRVVLGLLADGLEQDALRLVGRDAAHPLERHDLLLVCLRSEERRGGKEGRYGWRRVR